MKKIQWVQHALEYFGGSRDEPPPLCAIALSNSIFWGFWWAALSLLIYVFSGQSSKFIYIDF